MACAARLIILFAVAFSLSTLAGPMSSHFHLPTIQLARALPQICDVTVNDGNTCSEYWVPTIHEKNGSIRRIVETSI